MATGGKVTDNQNVSFGLCCGAIQGSMNIPAIDNYLGMRACIPLELGNFLRGEAHDFLLPYRVDRGSSGAKSFHAGGNVNEREPCPKIRGHLRCLRYGGETMGTQIHRAKNIVYG